MKKTDYHENAENWIADAMREHQAPLVRYVARLVGGDFDRAQDVVQDAFLRLCQQPEYAVRDHVVEWLYTVCRNRAVDVMRKEGRMRSFNDGEMERVSTAEARPGKSLEVAETQAAVLDLIDRLPKNQQEVVRLKFQREFWVTGLRLESGRKVYAVADHGIVESTAGADISGDYRSRVDSDAEFQWGNPLGSELGFDGSQR